MKCIIYSVGPRHISPIVLNYYMSSYFCYYWEVLNFVIKDRHSCFLVPLNAVILSVADGDEFL